ncbi:MAG: acetylglutamate kinase [Bacteroidaceae bacterium]|nr:acetylglutamate kinase [Bacteroidaceae bacterium]
MDTHTSSDLTVLKVGGAVVENQESLAQLIRDFAAIPGPKVLVHGGGRSATALASQLGIETKMVEGRRITDDEMLRVVTMVYGGLVNKNIVAQLQAAGINALGLTGADMDIIRSHRRPLKNGIDYGWVGDVDCADGPRLATLLQQGITPVIAPLTHDGQGHLLNTNADTMAQTVACALAPQFSVSLRFAFEKRGVMGNPDDPSSFIPHITEQDFQQLRAQGIVSGGMLPKLENAFQAIHQGVSEVLIGETLITA